MALSRKGTAAVAALLVLSGLTGFKFFASREKAKEGLNRVLPPSEPRPVALPVNVNLPDPAVGELRHDLEVLKDQVNNIGTQALAAQDPAVVDPGAEPPQPEDTSLAAIAAASKAEADGYDDRIKREPIDRNWSQEMAPRVTEFFSKPELVGSTMTRIDCASTLCRVGVRLDDVPARQVLLERVAGMIPPNSELFAHLDDPRDLEIEVYFSRTGGLPNKPPQRLQ